MQIYRILNNNVAVVKDTNGRESILMGKGICFQKKSGEHIDVSKIEKTFTLEDNNLNTKFQELLISIPLSDIRLANKIIQLGKASLGKTLNDSIYIALSDHISTAIRRFKNGIQIQNAMLWDIKRFYHQEFELGTMALEMIKKETGILLPEGEAAFIALHFANAQLDGQNQIVEKVTIAMQEIIHIITYTFGMVMDEDSVYYYRFITHLRFFAQRLFMPSYYETEKNEELFTLIKEKYRRAFICVEKINCFIKDTYQYQVNDDETLYLTIHLARIIQESERRKIKKKI